MIPPFFGLWASLIIGSSMSISLLLTQIIHIPLHPLVYVGYVVSTILIYSVLGFIFDLTMVPLFAKYRLFATVVYWILGYPVCRLPHEIITYIHLGYTIFTADPLPLLGYLIFLGFAHGIAFGALVMMFLRIWFKHLALKQSKYSQQV